MLWESCEKARETPKSSTESTSRSAVYNPQCNPLKLVAKAFDLPTQRLPTAVRWPICRRSQAMELPRNDMQKVRPIHAGINSVSNRPHSAPPTVWHPKRPVPPASTDETHMPNTIRLHKLAKPRAYYRCPPGHISICFNLPAMPAVSPKPFSRESREFFINLNLRHASRFQEPVPSRQLVCQTAHFRSYTRSSDRCRWSATYKPPLSSVKPGRSR